MIEVDTTSAYGVIIRFITQFVKEKMMMQTKSYTAKLFKVSKILC